MAHECHTRRVMKQRVAGVGAMLGALFMLGACGSNSQSASDEPTGRPALTHAQYQAALTEVVTSKDTRAASQLFLESVASDYQGEPCSEKVHALEKSLAAMVQQVVDLEPPPDAEDQHRDFLAAAKESVRLVGVAADDVADGNLSCGSALNKRIYGLPSTTRAEKAIEVLESRGYFILGQ